MLRPAVGAEPAAACVDAIRKVNERFHTDHTALEHLRGDTHGRSTTIEDADRMLRAIREAASKAIHASATCAAPAKATADDEDRDEDENDDKDKDEHKNDQKQDEHKSDQKQDEQKNEQKQDEQKQHEQRKEHATKPNVTFTETDPAAIAEKAVTMLDLVLETAKKALTSENALPSTSPKPHPTTHTDRKDRGHR